MAKLSGSIVEVITVGSFEIPSRAYVGSFNFRGSEQQKRVADLSGGERNRLHLAKLLRSGGNDHPISLLQKAGVDFTTTEPTEALVADMDSLVSKLADELEKLDS